MSGYHKERGFMQRDSFIHRGDKEGLHPSSGDRTPVDAWASRDEVPTSPFGAKNLKTA